MPAAKPFTLQIPDSAIADLRCRLERTRWPDEPPLEAWASGTSLTYSMEIAEYWRARFDWRAWEAKLNAFPQFTIPIAGIDLHFIHAPGRGPNPIPLLISHGWPGSVFEFYKLIPLLTERFTVVAPSLPGYTLSFRPGQKRFGVEEIAEVFASLMTDALGYRASAYRAVTGAASSARCWAIAIPPAFWVFISTCWLFGAIRQCSPTRAPSSRSTSVSSITSYGKRRATSGSRARGRRRSPSR